MSVIPVSSLSPGELRLLGNNLIHRRRRILTSVKLAKAVNRSLAHLGEEVTQLRTRQPWGLPSHSPCDAMSQGLVK